MTDQPSSSRNWTLVLPTLVLVIVAGAAVFYLGRKSAPGSAPTTFVSHGPTIEKLQELGSLVTLKVHVADVLEGRSASWWGDVSGAWLIKGDALLGVDMRKASFVSRDEAARRAVVRLPAPAVMSARVDHAKTRTYEIRTGLFRMADVADALRDDAMRQAQCLIEQAAGGEENTALARDIAERLIRGLFKELGWTVEIKWGEIDH